MLCLCSGIQELVFPYVLTTIHLKAKVSRYFCEQHIGEILMFLRTGLVMLEVRYIWELFDLRAVLLGDVNWAVSYTFG